MLEQIVYEFRPLLKDKELSFSTKIEPDVQIYCDVDKTERIIDNLIRNAISYSYPNTEIQITLESDDANVTLTFINSGKTIPKEKLERIFEQFFPFGFFKKQFNRRLRSWTRYLKTACRSAWRYDQCRKQ